MILALEEAKKAYKKGEVPIGAVIVCGGKVIAKGHNKKEKKHMVDVFINCYWLYYIVYFYYSYT